MSSVKKPRGGWIAPAIFVAAFLAGAGIVYVAIAGMASGASLGDGAAVIDARVTDTRVVQYRRRGDSYEVRYAFDVGGQTYTYKDPTERTDLWAPLTREAWEAARTNGTTPVRYLPSDPLTNRAVHHAGDPTEGNIIGLVVGLILMLPATLWIVGRIRRRRGPMLPGSTPAPSAPS